MALISIIIGLFLDRAFCHLHDLRDMTWFEFYTQSILRLTGKRMPLFQFMLILALPVLLFMGIQILLYNFVFNSQPMYYFLSVTRQNIFTT